MKYYIGGESQMCIKDSFIGEEVYLLLLMNKHMNNIYISCRKRKRIS